MSLWVSFLLLCTFLTFSRHFSTVFATTVGAGFGENRAVFMQPLLKNWAIYPVALLFCYTVAFLTFLTAIIVIISSDLLEFELRNISFKLFFIHLAFFSAFGWLANYWEPLFGALPLPLTALSLIILVEGTISWELWLAFLPEKPG